MAEKKVVELNVQADLTPLKTQLKQAQQEVQVLSDKFGATSREAVEAAKKAAILKDRIGDAKALTDAFNPDAKFKALSGSLTGVAGGFSAVTGAMGAFGTQSEDVEKALLKVQSAMALASGLQAVGESVDSFKQLGGVIKDSYQKLLLFIAGQETQAVVATEVAVATQVEAVATEEATIAQISLNTAMKANPIGVVIVGVVALGAAIAGLIYAMGDHNEAADKQAETNKRLAEQAKEQRENIAKESGGFATLISRLKNTNAGTKEREDLIKKINGQYGTTLKNIKDEAKFQESLNKELASYLEYQKAKYTLQKNEDLIVKNLSKQDEIRAKIAKSQKDEETARKEMAASGGSNAIMLRAINSQVELQAQLEKELAKAEKRFNAYGSAANTAANNVDKITNSGTKYVEQNDKVVESTEEVIKTEEEYVLTQQDLMDKINAIKQANYLNNLSENDKEIALVNDKYAELENSAKGNAEYLADIELAKMNEINDINLKYQDLDYKQKEEWRLKTEEATKKASEKEIADAKAVAEQKAAIQQQGLDVAMQGVQLIKGLFEKSKGVQKAAVIAESAIGIAKMVIANKLANAGALATPQAIASSGVSAIPVIAMNNISTGIGIAANIAATAKALRTLGGGGAPSGGGIGGSGGGSGGSGGGGTTVMSPSFNVVGNSGINQLGQLQQKPMKAYVVSGDMSTAQSLDRNRIENATLVK